jgi:hypothetical protein
LAYLTRTHDGLTGCSGAPSWKTGKLHFISHFNFWAATGPRIRAVDALKVLFKRRQVGFDGLGQGSAPFEGTA